jgi:hypothetical protein
MCRSYHFARHWPAVYHACECAADTLSGVGICVPMTKDLSIESSKAILRAAGDPCASVGTNLMYGGRVLLSEVRDLKGGDAPCRWAAIGSMPSIVSMECGDNWWTEETYFGGNLCRGSGVRPGPPDQDHTARAASARCARVLTFAWFVFTVHTLISIRFCSCLNTL